MTGLKKEYFEQRVKRYADDPELYKELCDKMEAPAPEIATGPAATMGVTPEAFLARDAERHAETIVRANARPVMLVRDNRATTEFLGPDSQVWAGRVTAAQAILDRVIPSVGRVEVGNNPDFTWVGTGWLLADDIIVTNRHVAREFARRGVAGFTFRTGSNGGPMTSRIDFLEEAHRRISMEYAVTSVLWIATSDEPDVAFLRVKRATSDRPLPSPIPLAAVVTEDDFVATIGYPARDPRVPDQALVTRIFGEVFDKKRLAPGQIMGVGDDEFEHDCSTLGGNSGSVLVNLRTGQALGLHFSGLFMQANFAVTAPRVRELLRRVQQGELPGAIAIRGDVPPAVVPVAGAPVDAGSITTIRLQIPVEITVKVGMAVPMASAMPATSISAVTPIADPGTTPPQAALDRALAAARDVLAGNPDVVDVRLGYRFKGGRITDERVVVVEVKEKLGVPELRAAGKLLIPPQILGVDIDVRTAALAEQLKSLGIDAELLEARPKAGLYVEPPDLPLELVRERMHAIFHVSPDSGFPNLKAFLGRVRSKLTATMFEWEADHISDAIEAAMRGNGRSLKMVTQRAGTEDAVRDMKRRIGRKFQHVWASVGAGKLIPSSYHMKMATRDGEELWLSSGNWKDSGQPNLDPAGDDSTSIGPLRNHNREWHVIIANQTLARLFEAYIDFDFAEAQRVPLEEAVPVPVPDLFVPEAVFLEGLERVVAQYSDPLVVDRELEMQPLLTPDRDARRLRRIFMAHAIQMVRKGTRKIYVENQSFALLEGDNEDEFEDFFAALRDKQRAGVDVRIIFRDAREFGSGGGPSQQRLLERLKDFGLDTDAIKVQRKCHTKGIIVDSSELLLGSQNLTTSGALFNRDASLLVRDPEVAQYFERIFLFDWDNLATRETDELVGGVRIARADEETPVGFRRVSLAELLGES